MNMTALNKDIAYDMKIVGGGSTAADALLLSHIAKKVINVEFRWNSTVTELLPEDKITKTSIPDVYAVGDIRTKQLRHTVTAVLDGAMAVHSAEEYLAEEHKGSEK